MKRLDDDQAVAALLRLIESGGEVFGQGAAGSSTDLLAGVLHRRLERPVLLVTGHLDDADEAADNLAGAGVEVARFPAMELAPGASGINLELLFERLSLVQRVIEGDAPAVITASVQALMQMVPAPDRLGQLLRVIRPGQRLDPSELARWLTDCGYGRVETIDTAGEFAARGGIVDVFPPGGVPVRIDLMDDEVEGLFEVDLETMGSDRRIERLELVGAEPEALQTDEGVVPLPGVLPGRAIAVLAETTELAEQARSYLERVADARGILDLASLLQSCRSRLHAVVEMNQFAGTGAAARSVELPVRTLPTFSETPSEAVAELAALADAGDVIVFCQNEGEVQRMRELLAEFAPQAEMEVRCQYLHRGFCWGMPEPADGLRPAACVPYHELLHRYQTRRRLRRITTGRSQDAFIELQPGDYVVHRDHGIARFAGLQVLDTSRPTPEEFLTLEFARGAKLHVPASNVDLVQKYIGSSHGRPKLSRFGGRTWSKQKEKVKEAVRDLAAEMLRMQAAREALPGIRYPADTTWQKEFEAEFPYEETEDQLGAIVATKRDMIDPRPMDRLICGDVGFGKTEVAIRAAFKAVEYGKQVVVLVPTTVLAEQHEMTFRSRFADYPFRIESLSRFKTTKHQKEILTAIRMGHVDIVIGTHRLLSKDVHFADLGLVIIDEEQRFGVEHKQRLLAFRATADVLTLTATPIPRTLHMALLGLRDISSLTTPPADRRSIVTEVLAYDSRRIQQAIQRELAREGQVFFVHNRVYNIQAVADDVQRLAPQARVLVGHGQMSPRELESVMLRFMRGEAEILVSTAIVESGIDIPRANTMFINDAQNFGLADLHQLRGRVGRFKHRAYCYLLLPPDRVLSPVALRRLRAIEGFSMLGAGFQIALRDLEIRGAGNLLGAEQSGHIAAVGYEMYCRLLEQSVQELKHAAPEAEVLDTTIDIGVRGAIPKGYIPADARRMDAYRRLSRVGDLDDLAQLEHDLVSAYGPLPRHAETLLHLTEIRISAAALGIRSISRHEGDLIFRTAQPGALEERMDGARGSLRLVGQPDGQGLTQVYYRPPPSYFETDTLLTVLRNRLRPGAADRLRADRASAEPQAST